MELQDGARVFTGNDAAFQSQAAQGSGEGGCSVPSEKLGPVGGETVDRFAGDEEGGS